MTAEIFRLPLGWNDCYLVREKGTIMIDAGEKNKTPALKKALKAGTEHVHTCVKARASLKQKGRGRLFSGLDGGAGLNLWGRH